LLLKLEEEKKIRRREPVVLLASIYPIIWWFSKYTIYVTFTKSTKEI